MFDDDDALDTVIASMADDKSKIWNSIELAQFYFDYGRSVLTRRNLTSALCDHFGTDLLLVLSSLGVANLLVFRQTCKLNIVDTDEEIGDVKRVVCDIDADEGRGDVKRGVCDIDADEGRGDVRRVVCDIDADEGRGDIKRGVCDIDADEGRGDVKRGVCDIDADEGRGDVRGWFVILTQTKVEEM